MSECPCDKCVCVPMCQNKQWFRLVQDCALICKYFRVIERTIIANQHKDVDVFPLNHKYRLSKSMNGTISYGLRRNEQISTLVGIVDADNNIGVW